MQAENRLRVSAPHYNEATSASPLPATEIPSATSASFKRKIKSFEIKFGFIIQKV